MDEENKRVKQSQFDRLETETVCCDKDEFIITSQDLNISFIFSLINEFCYTDQTSKVMCCLPLSLLIILGKVQDNSLTLFFFSVYFYQTLS